MEKPTLTPVVCPKCQQSDRMFMQEEIIETREVFGLNPETGMIKVYRKGEVALSTTSLWCSRCSEEVPGEFEFEWGI